MEDLLSARFGPNAGLVIELYKLFEVDPNLVNSEWRNFFSGLLAIPASSEIDPSESKKNGHHSVSLNGDLNGAAINGHLNGSRNSSPQIAAEAAVLGLQAINLFRAFGHLNAAINPLHQGISPLPQQAELEELKALDSSKAVFVADGPYKSKTTLGELVASLEKNYTGSVGFECEHLLSSEERKFFRDRIEGVFGERSLVDNETRLQLLRGLVEAEGLESELHRKFVGAKRFSVQGAETVLPMLRYSLEKFAELGGKAAVFGMAHRGRLAVLTQIIGKPLRDIISEFEDKSAASVVGAGDVKYHMGHRADLNLSHGRKVEVILAYNPSHLEFVNPVVEGMVKGIQESLSAAEEPVVVMPVLIHGDAAFIGQGVVPETLNMAKLPGYETSGTVHVVINNQVGFTTNPASGRSSVYCTDLAKAFDAPVFHCNAEDVESCAWVMGVATEYRMLFKKDVVVDLYCYRKYGHNEGDDPTFTQPLMYQELKGKKSIAELYAESLDQTELQGTSTRTKYQEEFAAQFKFAESQTALVTPGPACPTHGELKASEPYTAGSEEQLSAIVDVLVPAEEVFGMHPKLRGILEKRVQTWKDGEGIDYGLAEALAYGSLMQQGISVRLSGQDCGRGTFSHRHLELHHFSKDEVYYPLNALNQKGKFAVLNSSLSENSVMGFEFGFGSIREDTLVLWEGQFGDFANGAQVIIDQFVSSAEAKWFQRSGLTLLLPHGYEGQGPEHSSARLERFLQLCAENNMSVCYPSSAVQHFHLLRRQGLRVLKRPLIVMTPKSMLRQPESAGKKAEFISGKFEEVISEGEKGAKYLVFLSGKIYYEVRAALKQAKIKSVGIVRLEQLYPYGKEAIENVLSKTSKAKCLWVQEEPENMGAWRYVNHNFKEAHGIDLKYFGRPASASTACGSVRRHAEEQKKIIDGVLATLGV